MSLIQTATFPVPAFMRRDRLKTMYALITCMIVVAMGCRMPLSLHGHRGLGCACPPAACVYEYLVVVKHSFGIVFSFPEPCTGRLQADIIFWMKRSGSSNHYTGATAFLRFCGSSSIIVRPPAEKQKPKDGNVGSTLHPRTFPIKNVPRDP